MQIFIVSKYGDSIDLARKLVTEGHEVHIYIRSKLFRDMSGDGITVTTNPTAKSVSSDLVIIEDYDSSEFADKARSMNRPVIGGGMLVDKLMKDREFAYSTAVGMGIKPAEEKTKGISLEIGGWFNGQEFLKPYFLGVKYSRLGVGDVGPVTRGMGVIGWYKMKTRLPRETLLKAETFLRAAKYHGYFGCECLINNSSIRLDRFVVSLGFPTANVLTSLHGNYANFLHKIATGRAQNVAIQPDRMGIGVVCIDPYVLHNHKEPKGLGAVVTSTGESLEEVRSKVYKDIHRTQDESIYYRTDIGSNVPFVLKRLKEGEWL